MDIEFDNEVDNDLNDGKNCRSNAFLGEGLDATLDAVVGVGDCFDAGFNDVLDIVNDSELGLDSKLTVESLQSDE